MRFLCLYKPAQPEGAPPDEAKMATMGKLIEDSSSPARSSPPRAACLAHSVHASRVTDGKFKVTDGPFTEAKEIVGGFALIQAKSKEDAVEFTKSFMKIAGDGEVEIRQVFEQPAQ